MEGSDLKLFISYAITAMSISIAVLTNAFRMGEKKGEKTSLLQSIKDRLMATVERMDNTERAFNETGGRLDKTADGIQTVMKRMDEWHQSKTSFESSVLAKFSGLNERIDSILVVHADIYSRIGRLEARHSIAEEWSRKMRDAAD